MNKKVCTGILLALTVGVGNVLAEQAIRYTAPELYKKYQFNAAAANREFKGKTVEVSGTVQSVVLNEGFRAAVVHLQGGTSFHPVVLEIDWLDEQRAARLRQGRQATVRCSRMESRRGAPYGTGCRIMRL